MTVFDYTVLIILFVSMVLGAWRGVVSEIIALVAWVLAFFAARWIGSDFARLLPADITDPAIRLVIAWVLIFVAVLLLMAFVRVVIRGLLKKLGLSMSDRMLGVFFGTARGVAIVLVMVALGGAMSMARERWWSEAYFSAPLETAVLACKPWLPPDVAKQIRFR